MHIYSIVNVENIKLYESSMLDQEFEHVLRSLEVFVPEAQKKLVEAIILRKKFRTTRK